MAVLKDKGHMLGAPKKLDAKLRAKGKKMLAQKIRKKIGGKTVWRNRYSKLAVANALKVSVGTVYNLLDELSET
jgi:hypothetical protein